MAAGMVELVDTQDLKSCERKLVRVRFPLLVQNPSKRETNRKEKPALNTV